MHRHAEDRGQRAIAACRQYAASMAAMTSDVGGTRTRRGAGFPPARTELQNATALARLAADFASDRALPPFRLKAVWFMSES